ncbi:MAG: septum formation initiator family protein [Chloroflexota bacterium]|nr:septum formation initiator family protein [Chloroflexota bacterium]
MVLLATAVVVVYLLFTAGSNAISTFQLRQDEATLRDEVQKLEERYRQLSALRDYLNSDEYIEWAARRQLGLVRSGEMGIIVQPLASPTPPAEGEEGEGSQSGQPPQRWWEALIGD